jgi:hypothetical protein
VADSGSSRREGSADGEEIARRLFQTLWRLDVIAVALDRVR